MTAQREGRNCTSADHFPLLVQDKHLLFFFPLRNFVAENTNTRDSSDIVQVFIEIVEIASAVAVLKLLHHHDFIEVELMTLSEMYTTSNEIS